MGTNSKIEWTDHTFNPWIGCTKVSEGCAHCYAKATDDRHLFGQASHWGLGAPRRRTSESNWREPLRWAKRAQEAGVRAKVFCASQADVFEAEAPEGAQRDLFNLIHITSDWIDWLLLTKRPQLIVKVLAECGLPSTFLLDHHCWLGVSAENQARADERIPILLATPAAVHFISAEPLLNQVNLCEWILTDAGRVCRRELGGHDLPNLDWVICGGESGPNARPMHSDWALSLRDQCAAAGVPFFFKQWGEWLGAMQDGRSGDGQVLNASDKPVLVGKKAAGALLDGMEHKAFPKARE